MIKLNYLTLALAAGLVASITTGIKAANAETNLSILVPFTAVARDTCHTQTTASSPTTRENSMCDTHREVSFDTSNTGASQDNSEATISAQEASSELPADNATTAQLTTVVR